MHARNRVLPRCLASFQRWFAPSPHLQHHENLFMKGAACHFCSSRTRAALPLFSSSTVFQSVTQLKRWAFLSQVSRRLYTQSDSSCNLAIVSFKLYHNQRKDSQKAQCPQSLDVLHEPCNSCAPELTVFWAFGPLRAGGTYRLMIHANQQNSFRL